LWQVPVLILLAGLGAMSINHFRGHGIPLKGDWSEGSRYSDASGESLVIPLEQAAKLFQEKTVLFVDARPLEQYAQGHIHGALSLPWQDLDAHYMDVVDRLDGAKKIVTYCDGENCELSHDLALFLKDSGFKEVRVLVNGWTLWRDAGLPTEAGEQGHE
jgi:rhodanese-related sulfurtransferase